MTWTSPDVDSAEQANEMARSSLDPGYGKYGDGRYDSDAETKALADGTATPAATPTTQPTPRR